jgi:hypothetical protein
LITFDRIFCTKGDDTVSGIKMQACNPPMVNHATNGANLDKCIDVNRFHEILVRCGADRLQKTAKIHGIRLKCNVEVFEDNVITKAREKNVDKEWKGGSKIPGERIRVIPFSNLKLISSYGTSCIDNIEKGFSTPSGSPIRDLNLGPQS